MAILFNVKGWNNKEFALLSGGGYAVGDSGCVGLFCSVAGSVQLNNTFFSKLLTDDETGLSKTDVIIKELMKEDAELKTAVDEYAGSNDKFLSDFSVMWTKMSNIDRFDRTC